MQTIVAQPEWYLKYVQFVIFNDWIYKYREVILDMFSWCH